MTEEPVERDAAEQVLGNLDADEHGGLGDNDAARVQTDLALRSSRREQAKKCDGGQWNADDAQGCEEALAGLEPGCAGVVTEPRPEEVTERQAER